MPTTPVSDISKIIVETIFMIVAITEEIVMILTFRVGIIIERKTPEITIADTKIIDKMSRLKSILNES